MEVAGQNAHVIGSQNQLWLRPATQEDEALLHGWLRNPRDCMWAIAHTPFRSEDYISWMGAADQHLWVLETDDGPIGYGEVWIDDEAGDVELAHLVIAPEQRGRGNGKRLVELLYEIAVTTGYSHVYMRVSLDNESALSCYRQAGFADLTDVPSDWQSDYVWLRRSAR